MRSSRSRLQLSTQRSATPFCQGLPDDVYTGLISKDRTAAGSSRPYFASRAKIKNLGVDPNGNASRNCWMIKPLVGCFVTLTSKMCRRIMTVDEKAMERAEGDRWNSEKVHRGNRFPVITEKGKPAPGQLRIARCTFHPTRNRSLRDIKTKHEKLAMDAWRSPGLILSNHTEDQGANLFADTHRTGAQHIYLPLHGLPQIHG